ncbi:hypothetical protein DJ030_06380 [bacterium endosymbiont of Escarpia laminata]|nr:MAG: hypothetical protein DJ030_06380 [bacterium endosymbiont of Escarpia laminata]
MRGLHTVGAKIINPEAADFIFVTAIRAVSRPLQHQNIYLYAFEGLRLEAILINPFLLKDRERRHIVFHTAELYGVRVLREVGDQNDLRAMLERRAARQIGHHLQHGGLAHLAALCIRAIGKQRLQLRAQPFVIQAFTLLLDKSGISAFGINRG